jgi:peptide chain release factor 1
LNRPASICGDALAAVFDAELIDERPSSITLQVTGPTARDTFSEEAGGHRWQRVPPNEKRGRVHTSTVTVAVFAEPEASVFHVAASDLEWMFKRGTGPGGQHRNKTESAVVLRHKPSGLVVQCQSERSQHRNKASALAVLTARLWDRQRFGDHAVRAADRRQQVGSGMRGDKRRTIRVQDGQVHDHLTGRRWRLEPYLNGEW